MHNGLKVNTTLIKQNCSFIRARCSRTVLPTWYFRFSNSYSDYENKLMWKNIPNNGTVFLIQT